MATQPMMKGLTPILRIFDESKAKEFYIGFLGFQLDWEHRFEPDMPLYMQISYGGCNIHLSEHYGDCSPGGAVRIEVNAIKIYHEKLLSAHYKYARPGLETTPWQTLEMQVHDPFGNKILFYENLK